jgi:hypothetical protein
MEQRQDRRLDDDDLFLTRSARAVMADVSPTDRWNLAESEVIDWREWGEEFVVRMASRAETHLLSPAAGNVLLALLDGRPTLTLKALFAKAFDDADTGLGTGSTMTAGDLESLQAIVTDFERLGIVRRSTA